MKVKLKFGHHNGERFYSAGEVMECPKKLGISLLRQGLAAFVKEEKETKQKQTALETAEADNSDTQTAETENAPDNADVQLETEEK